MKKDFWKDNGILISLYGIVGVLVVTAGILTVNSLTISDTKSTGLKTAEVAVEENVQVQSSIVESYKEQLSKIQEQTNENEIDKLKNSLKEDVKSTESLDTTSTEKIVTDVQNSLLGANSTEESKELTAEASSLQEDVTVGNTNIIEEANSEEVVETIKVEESVENEEGNSLDKINKETSTEIEEGILSSNEEVDENLETTKLTWPIDGEIVMEFNNEVLVYDQTLNLYRTNDSISISADKGEQVVASADGKVVEIGTSIEEQGYIVLEHSDGYQTRYSQLVDSFIVKQGDTIRRGQIIGHIGEPSTSTIKQGNHLQYSVVKNEIYVNPLSILE